MAINVEAFYDMINGVAKKQVDASRTDKTIDAVISKLYNADIGEYKVEYQGNIFSAFVPDPTVEYKGGERVYVLVPEGDFSRKKIILGRSDYQNALSDIEATDLSNTYIQMGPNFLGEDYYLPAYDPLEICAVPSSDKGKLDFRNSDGARYGDCGWMRYPFVDDTEEGVNQIKENPKWIREEYTRYPATMGDLTPETLDEIDEEFQNYAKVASHITFSAAFQTKFLSTHSTGEYYIELKFIAENPRYREEGHPQKEERSEEIPYQIVTHRLDFKSFNGSPYLLPQATRQTAHFPLESGSLLGLYSMTLCQDGQMAVDIRPYYNDEGDLVLSAATNGVFDKNNIIATDFDLHFSRRIDMLSEPFFVWIETPQGTSLCEAKKDADGKMTSPGRYAIDLIPHMIFKQQDVTEDCTFIWLKEDLSIPDEFNPNEKDRDEHGRNYLYYAGPGWRPIKHLMEDGVDCGYQLSEDDTLTISKTYDAFGTQVETVPWQWKYKLIGIYGDEVFGYDVVTIKNTDSKYDLFVEQLTQGVAKHQALRINDHNARVGVDVDPAGNPDPSILHKDSDDPDLVNNFYPEWFGSWYYQLGDNSYNKLEENPLYHGPVDIQSTLIYNHIKYRVMCYDPHMVVPPTGVFNGDYTNARSVNAIGILDYDIMSPEADGLLIEWEGEKSFNYTAMNKAYDSAYDKDHKLAVKVNFVHGEKGKPGRGTDYDVWVLAPDGQPLANQAHYNKQLNPDGTETYTDEGLGHEVANSMMTAMYFDNNFVVHFKLKDQFNIDYTNNTFTAIVHYFPTDEFYTSECPVIFTKDGQGGTQGSEWSAPIRLTNTKTMQATKVIYNGVEVNAHASEPFTLPVNNLRPLLLNTKGRVGDRIIYEEYNMPGYTNNGGSGPQLVLRPFVTKEGRALESIADIIEKKKDEDVDDGVPGLRNDHKHYKIVANWDVRYPQNAAVARAAGRSFLALVDPRTGVEIDSSSTYAKGNGRYCTTVWSGIPAELEADPNQEINNALHNAIGIKFKPSAFGEPDELPANYDYNAFIKKWQSTIAEFNFTWEQLLTRDKGDPLTRELKPIQEWPEGAKKAVTSDLTEGKSRMPVITSETAKEFLRLWRAKHREDKDDSHAISLEEMAYNFVVKCEIEIYTDIETNIKQYDDAGRFRNIDDSKTNEGTVHRLKTIMAYYPVDVFIFDGQLPDAERINISDFWNETYINWPKEVIYDSRGNNPTTDGDKLEFFITFQKDNQEKTLDRFIEPHSLTPLLATIQKQDEGLGLPKELQVIEQNRRDQQTPATQRSLSTYTWKPRAHLNWQEGTVATLMGKIDKLYRETCQVTGRFYRNQVYHLNSFENVDINGWDGQGIDIDEDRGTIFAPTIGAGFKGVFSNRFTGVLMGVNKGFPRPQRGEESYNQFFLDQFRPTDTELKELELNPFMTGLFGYQQGQASFGILENGTAFFGRADRGGRIIIDGYNATIYGGANGELGSPEIGDPMWNNMRLNLVDLTHSVGTTEVQGVAQGMNGKFFGMEDTEDSVDKNGFTLDKTQRNELPPWYRFIWEFSYIKQRGARPWFLIPNDNENPDAYKGGLGEGYVTYGDEIDNQMREVPFDSGITFKDTAYGHLLNFYDKNGFESMDYSRDDNRAINYWKPITEQVVETDEDAREDKIESMVSMLLNNAQSIGNSNKGTLDGTHPLSGFGASRASTTPAIEIGQHPDGLMPGLLPWGAADYVLRTAFIPGDRNFMVTYDGTLWAMNGVFMGNVIGSNIVGGRMQGVELGIGPLENGDKTYYAYTTKSCSYPVLLNPFVEERDIVLDDHANGAFSVDAKGNVIANSLSLLGGRIDIGSFHIMGEAMREYEGSGKGVAGALLQLGESDFIGPTHFYGNVGIGPLLYPTSLGRDGQWQYGDGFDAGEDVGIKNTGNIFQTNGLASFGIYLPIEEFQGTRTKKGAAPPPNINYHKFATEVQELFFTSNKYLATQYGEGDPKIEALDDSTSIEQVAMFTVNTRTRNPVKTSDDTLVGAGNNPNPPGYMGHFWPLAFRYAKAGLDFVDGGNFDENADPVEAKGVHAYATMMDIFESKTYSVNMGSNAGASGEASGSGIAMPGGNYFRVGPWGMEAQRMYVCASWQKEQESRAPKPSRRAEGTDTQYGVRGIVGIVDRHGTGGGETISPAIGITSWGKAPIIFSSCDNYAERVAGSVYNNYCEKNKTVHEKRQFDTWQGDGQGQAVQNSITREAYWLNGATNIINGDFANLAGECPQNLENGDEAYHEAMRFGFGISYLNSAGAWTSHPQDNRCIVGIFMDPQKGGGYTIPGGAGNGGHYIYGKDGTGVHIFQKEGREWNSGQDGIDSTELFLYHEQASLVGQKAVYMGTHSKNFSSPHADYAGIQPKDRNGVQGGISHAPDTKNGAGMVFREGGWRVSFKDGFSITGGTSLMEDANGGYHNDASPYTGIGGDKNHTEYFHKNVVAIHQGTVGDGTMAGGKEVPKIFVGAGKAMDKGNKIWITDSKGGMEGIDGKVYMRDSWAIPDNQFCIYARFG